MTDYLLPTLTLATMFFLYRKVYFHYKFLGLHYPKLKDKPIGELIFEPLTVIEHFYILIPIFIKSDKRKEGEELRLETKIVNSLRTFWIMFGVTLIIGIIVFGRQHNQ